MMQVQFNRCVIAAQDPRAPENVLIPDADTTHKFTLAELEALLAECDKELARTNPVVEEKLRLKRKRAAHSAPAER